MEIDVYSIIGQSVVLGLEIYFIVWTIKTTRKNRNDIEIIRNRLDTMWRERTDDHLKIQQMQRRIEELEKQNKNAPE